MIVNFVLRRELRVVPAQTQDVGAGRAERRSTREILGLVKVTVPGPETLVHATSTTLPTGKPSSVAVPFSVADWRNVNCLIRRRR